jgi:hypothetical protein
MGGASHYVWKNFEMCRQRGQRRAGTRLLDLKPAPVGLWSPAPTKKQCLVGAIPCGRPAFDQKSTYGEMHPAWGFLTVKAVKQGFHGYTWRELQNPSIKYAVRTGDEMTSCTQSGTVLILNQHLSGLDRFLIPNQHLSGLDRFLILTILILTILILTILILTMHFAGRIAS